MLISELVYPFASCVWEWQALHGVSHSFKTILMLNAHPYISLLKWIALTHTHRFWLSLFLSFLFYMLLNHLFVASARLCFLLVHLHLLWVSIDFRGVMILFLCTWCPNANILRSAQIMGSFTSVFRTLSLALVVRFYWSWGSDDPILCSLYPITKLNCAQIMGSFSRTLLCSYHNIFYSCGT